MRLKAVVVAILMLVCVACGGGDDVSAPETTPETTPTPDLVSLEEFQEEVNQACTEEHERVDALFTDFPDEPTPEFIQSFIGEFAASFEIYRDDLVAVGPPEGHEDEYAEYLKIIDTHLAELQAGAEDREKAVELFNQSGKDPMAKLEKSLGLDTCASR